MAAGLDKLYGIHAQSLALQQQRLQHVAANIANADTPNYRAKDIDFQTALAQAAGASDSPALQRTNDRHLNIAGIATVAPAGVATERDSTQPSQDGNTVELHREQAAFADAALRYRASLQFAQGRLTTLMSAIRGE